MIRPILKIACVNAVILMAGLVILEMVWGNWFGTGRINRLNLLKDVDYSFSVDHLYPSREPVRYKRDQFGLRGNYPGPGKIDILTLGGSATDQRYITEGKTWQDVLAADFKLQGKDLSVVNAGLDGQSTIGHIKNFDLWFPVIPGFKARYILVYLGVNDIFTEQALSANDDLAGEKTWKGMVKSKSALFRLYQTIRGSYLARFKYPVDHRKIDFAGLNWTEYPVQKNQGWRSKKTEYGARVRLMLRKIRETGAVPILVTQASMMCKQGNGKILGAPDRMTISGTEMNGVDFCRLKSVLDQETLSACREAGGICIDLASELSLGETDFYDYFHNTPQGARKIGDYLFGKLRFLP